MKNAALEVSSRLYLSGPVLKLAALPSHLRATARTADPRSLAVPVIAVCASEMLTSPRGYLPEWNADSDTRYLVLVDVPEPAVLRLLRAIRPHRPDYRLYLTRDPGTVQRLVISLTRRQPVLGIVDAYVLGGELNVLAGDFEQRSFPIRRIPELAVLKPAERVDFRIDRDGSYLYWPSYDVHVGVSQLLQHFDPMFMVDVEIERNERDQIGAALRTMREENGLRQTDIPGLGERQVHRIETGVSRLRFPSVQKFAAAFGMEPRLFLDALAARAAELRSKPSRQRRGGRRPATEIH